MGVLFEYFAAPSDEAAAATVDRPGGPGGTAEGPAYDVVPGGVDPVVQLGTLEELLTGRPYDDIAAESPDPVAVRDGGERVVVPVSERLQAALAAADEQRLREVAGPWAGTDEFFGTAGGDDLVPFLSDLARLARAAGDRGERLYCWVSV